LDFGLSSETQFFDSKVQESKSFNMDKRNSSQLINRTGTLTRQVLDWNGGPEQQVF
jgi:hypothetical protein